MTDIKTAVILMAGAFCISFSSCSKDETGAKPSDTSPVDHGNKYIGTFKCKGTYSYTNIADSSSNTHTKQLIVNVTIQEGTDSGMIFTSDSNFSVSGKL